MQVVGGFFDDGCYHHSLFRFIASGRLHAKIDKVGGIVVTNRPDSKNGQYQTCIKQGDILLNRWDIVLIDIMMLSTFAHSQGPEAVQSDQYLDAEGVVGDILCVICVPIVCI